MVVWLTLITPRLTSTSNLTKLRDYMQFFLMLLDLSLNTVTIFSLHWSFEIACGYSRF